MLFGGLLHGRDVAGALLAGKGVVDVLDLLLGGIKGPRLFLGHGALFLVGRIHQGSKLLLQFFAALHQLLQVLHVSNSSVFIISAPRCGP